MATKLVYKRIAYGRKEPEYSALNSGTYQAPEGWRVHSMAVTETEDSYVGVVHLLLEASVPDGEPYR